MRSAPRFLPLTYGVGSIGTGVFTTVPSVLLLYYLNKVVGIDAAIAGIVILIPKSLGLVGDPLVGAWADRLRSSAAFGRKALMWSGALLAGCGLWALFSLPHRSPGNVAIPAIIYFICTTGYSFFAVPYSSLPAELDDRPLGRQRLVATRLGISFLGTLIGGVVAPLIASRLGYPIMGAIVGVACIAAMGAFLLTCPLPQPRESARLATATATDEYRVLAGNRQLIIQMVAFILLLALLGTAAALLPFVVHDLGASSDVVGIAMLVDIVAALGSSALWPRLIRSLGLRTAWQLAAAITGVAAAMIGFAPSVGSFFYLGMALSGVGMAGVQITGFSGLADLTADLLERDRSIGLVTGIWMAGEKAGLAIGPLLAGFGLKFMGGALTLSAARSSLMIVPIVLAAMSIGVIAFARPREDKQAGTVTAF